MAEHPVLSRIIHYMNEYKMYRFTMQPKTAGSGAAFLVAQLGAHAAMLFAGRLARLKLQPQHAGALRVLASAEGMTQRALAERLGMFPSRAVALIDEMEGRGLVVRDPDPSDRRSHSLRLTDKGRRALADIGQVAREHQDALLAALDPGERERLAQLLLKVAAQQGLTPNVHPGFRRL
jgi:DNA-binding MarR family transcriptional regulator